MEWDETKRERLSLTLRTSSLGNYYNIEFFKKRHQKMNVKFYLVIRSDIEYD